MDCPYVEALERLLGCVSDFRDRERTALHLSPRLYAEICQVTNAFAVRACRSRGDTAPGLANQGGVWAAVLGPLSCLRIRTSSKMRRDSEASSNEKLGCLVIDWIIDWP